MVLIATRIAQLEKELEEARAQLWKEDAERYRILMREISEDEKNRINEHLTDRHERVLFGLEAEEEPRRAGGGGEETCSICGKTGFTKRGLALHRIRMHKMEKATEKEEAA